MSWWSDIHGRQRPWHDFWHPKLPTKKVGSGVYMTTEDCGIMWDNSFMMKRYKSCLGKLGFEQEWFDYPKGYILKEFKNGKNYSRPGFNTRRKQKEST